MIGLDIRGDFDATEVTEAGRYLGAIDAGAIVGGADSYSSSLVVPGGAVVPHAAVTHVGVLPTHRRRGILRSLITEQLRDIAARGEVVATLRASEAVIYERFGYGIASAATSQTIDIRRTRLRDTLPATGDVRIVDAAATTALLAEIASRSAWVGAITRPPGWWRLRELRAAHQPTVEYVAVYQENGIDQGYVTYVPENTETWFTTRQKTITVTDFVALSDTARIGLWRHLFDLDLIDVIRLSSVAVDDALPLAVTDPRAVSAGPVVDETWLRLVDVERALAARTYNEADRPVYVQVTDPLIASNNDIFEIGVKTSTRASTATPDVTVDVATLAAVYLGGTRWHHLGSVGRVAVHRDGALAELDGLFATTAAPYSGTGF
ncbi:MAG: GNAT family N-acetyltransferase [Gordonia sp. (in: high G+C Gram-positive bacteria)]